MEKRVKVKRLLEIPARKHKRETIAKEAATDKSYLLVIDLRIFRFEYSKEVIVPDNPTLE
ncbi:hypothetical protein OOZ15_19700 [Galbibacter sp. EGI 63066]|uniref:hypothetical protein n=1 Tax=Galbibacter sp. EGI 63066 TaxID=2993559 RepID=UPI002248DA53|nr:hypothetical protein [Galbibacter sp. EGI 63066]MCX2682175.1 hypothetical protein [Galbibacter sp. EGI 63066]